LIDYRPATGALPTAATAPETEADIFIHRRQDKNRRTYPIQPEYDLSIILCTKNRADLLDQTLTSIKDAAKGLAYEVIVVVGDCADHTVEVLRKHRIRNVYDESEWLGPGSHSWPQLYNFGFSRARGKWAMYASDDIVFGNNALALAVRFLDECDESVCGGVFFYKNVHAQPGWDRFGIDFTYGQKLLMNYGLVRLDHFKQVGGLDESYRFYCADTDLCLKLYRLGKQLLPLSGCFVIHNNILDERKKANLQQSDRDIQLLLSRWAHFVPTTLPNPRRLIWDETLELAFDLPAKIDRIDESIEFFWHGLALLQQGRFSQAKDRLKQALEVGCDHWITRWYLARSAWQCSDTELALQMAESVTQQAPEFDHARDWLTRIRRQLPTASTTATVSSDVPELSSHTGNAVRIGALIFSKDRPLQLDAALQSFLLHCADPETIELHVLYLASDDIFASQYKQLKAEFPQVEFIAQSNFKQQVQAVVGSCDLILFMVDDNIFVRRFCLAEAARALLDNDDALGFSLRLGTNTQYCYTQNAPQPLPNFESCSPRILKYDWTTAHHDFGCPLELSSSLYRCAEIGPLLQELAFDNPNHLEAALAGFAGRFASSKPHLLCYERSVVFSNPLNRVQLVYPNRTADSPQYDPTRLRKLFAQGYRVDVGKYAGFVPDAAHQEQPLHLVRPDATAADQARLSEQQIAKTDPPTSAGPKFSIVMANYNNARYLTQAVDSVLAQTFEDWELIIVDDGSTDDSVQCIERYLKDPRIRLVRHETNRGYTAALKTGIANVRSEYFGILDSDDALLPEAIETMYQWHRRLPEHGLIYSQFLYCDEQLEPQKQGFCAPIPAGKTALEVNVVSHFKTFKLRHYLRTPGYDENILYAEDLDLVYKMEEVTKLKFIDRALYLYRSRPGSLSRDKTKINVAIMSRVKARLNALKRRAVVSARATGQDFEHLFRQAVAQAKQHYPDVRQYFELLARLDTKGAFDEVTASKALHELSPEDRLLWLAANVDIDFEKLFASLRHQLPARTSSPLVTIYMVCYNTAEYIKQAIDSVLDQSYSNFELLIVDDGSTDGTPELIASYTDPRIRFVRQAHAGFAAGMNRAIRLAKGQFILGVDSDDFVAPDYLDKMVACALEHPDVDYFYPHRLTLVDADGRPTGTQWSYRDFQDNRQLPAFLLRHAFGPIPNPGSLKRKALFDKTGLYDQLETLEDFVFLCRNALRIKFMRVDDHGTYYYRTLPSSNSRRFHLRDRIIARTLNNMVRWYSPELLVPELAAIEDGRDRRRRFYEYLMETFYRHAASKKVHYPEPFRRYGHYYRRKLMLLRQRPCLCESAV